MISRAIDLAHVPPVAVSLAHSFSIFAAISACRWVNLPLRSVCVARSLSIGSISAPFLPRMAMTNAVLLPSSAHFESALAISSMAFAGSIDLSVATSRPILEIASPAPLLSSSAPERAFDILTSADSTLPSSVPDRRATLPSAVSDSTDAPVRSEARCISAAHEMVSEISDLKAPRLAKALMLAISGPNPGIPPTALESDLIPCVAELSAACV